MRSQKGSQQKNVHVVRTHMCFQSWIDIHDVAREKFRPRKTTTTCGKFSFLESDLETWNIERKRSATKSFKECHCLPLPEITFLLDAFNGTKSLEMFSYLSLMTLLTFYRRDFFFVKWESFVNRVNTRKIFDFKRWSLNKIVDVNHQQPSSCISWESQSRLWRKCPQ